MRLAGGGGRGGWRGKGRMGEAYLSLAPVFPPRLRLESLASSKFPGGQFIHMTVEETSHLSLALSPTAYLVTLLLLLLTPGNPGKKAL